MVPTRFVSRTDRGEPVEAGLHRGLGGAVDHQVKWRKVVEVVRAADVSVAELDTGGPQSRQVQFAAATLEAVQDRHA